MIRFAQEKDIPGIMKFIDNHWRKNHILSHDSKLFKFQHKWGNEVTFVLSEQDEEITGLLGFIPYRKTNRDVTLAIWKISKTEDTMQGIKILSYLRENGDIKSIAAPGINPKTIPIYKFLGLCTGKMKQWYRLCDISEYNIAKIVNKSIPNVYPNTDISIVEIDDFSCLNDVFQIDNCLIRDHQLIKSTEYIKRRYFEHPTFTYIKYGIMLDDKSLFIVLREQQCNGSAVLRLIDCIGDHEILKYFTPEIDRLLIKYNCEYCDCYETGIDDAIFKEGGWLPVSTSGNILPDYFAPFEQRNIDIYYMAENIGTILFKGDGDMDRPN